jgi:hypothetical protein
MAEETGSANVSMKRKSLRAVIPLGIAAVVGLLFWRRKKTG